MSSCLIICLVIVREIFLPQPDCLAITKVHRLNFSLLLIIQLSLTCFQTNEQVFKTEDTLCDLDISRQRPVCGLFPAKCQSLITADFSTN